MQGKAGKKRVIITENSKKIINRNIMKVVITSTGNSPDSLLDSRFGRCSYFVVFDTETKGTEYIPNSNIDSVEGAGIASAKLVASRGAEKVVSGEFGFKVKELFDSLGIQLIIVKERDKTIKDIITLIQK
ncbi:MAG: dinitrogenase iron-molybdenum cofactor biosynthesis protein [Bacteroidetes bacterium HGW-Bacteroidetes-10]|nr:MAG: dinitrogenase iron-molybdenum cofactor biosynthesis protein [Bacteroidetes bacterium HGW-Bacteroidetes-10]